MSMTEIATLGFAIDTGPLSAAEAALNRLAKTGADCEAALNRLSANASSAFSRVGAGLQAAAGLGSPATGAAGMATAAAAAGTATAAQHGLAGATTTATGALNAQTAAINRSASAHRSHGASAYNNSLAMQELSHVGRALFDEMAAGGNIFRALAMEGGRLQIALDAVGKTEGGLAGTLSRIGSGALGMVSPFAIGVTALAGFGVAAVVAAAQIRSLREEQERSLSGVGHATGLSAEGLGALGASGAAAAGLSVGTGRGIANTLAATGRFDPASINGVMGLTRGYAGAFGTDAETAGSQLSDIFREPVAGANKLNERLGFLNDATRKYITTLRDQGDAQGAIRALIDASSASMQEQAKPGGILERLGNWWGDRNARVQGWFTGPSAMERYQHDARFGGRAGGSVDIASEAEDLRRSGQLRKMQQDDVLANRLSLQAGGIVGLVNPDAARFRDLQDQQKMLAGALANPDVANRMAPGLDSGGRLVSGAGLLSDTLDKVNDRLANFMSGTEKQTLAINAQVQSINAWTLGEKLAAATAQEMASLGVRQIKTNEELLAIQSKQAEIIAHANDQAYNLQRSAADQLALAGKFGLDRTRAEIGQKFRDYTDTLGDLSGGRDLEGIGARFLRRDGMATPGMISDAQGRTGIPGSIIGAIGQIENGGRLTGGTTMLGSNGKPSSAWGFGQLTNGAAADVQAVVPGFSKYNPDTAVFGSAKYLQLQVERHHGDMAAALNAYGGRPDYASDVMRRVGGGIDMSPSSALGVNVDTKANLAAWRRDSLAAANIGTGEGIINAASVGLDQKIKAFDMMTASVGKTTAELAKYNAVVKLQNDLDRAKVEITPHMRAEMEQLGGLAASLAKREEANKSFIGTEDSVRSFSSNSMDSLFTGLAQGKPAGGLLRGIGQNLGQSLIRGGVGMLTQGLFGKSGQAGGGLFGGLLGNLVGLGHYAGGTQDAPGGPAIVGENGPELVRMPPHAQVVSTAALENLRPNGHTVHMGDTIITVQGNADERALAQMRQENAMAEQQRRDWIVRNLPQIQADGNQTS